MPLSSTLFPLHDIIQAAFGWTGSHQWLKTEVEIRVARASLFAAQAIARDLIAAGRENEVEETREFISTIMPDLPDKKTQPASPTTDRTASSDGGA